MKRIITIILVLSLIMSIGIQANAIFDKSELFGVWYNPGSQSKYILINEGGIGMYADDLTSIMSYDTQKSFRWSVEDNQYLIIETASMLGTQVFYAFRIDQKDGQIILRSMSYSGLVDSLKRIKPESIKSIFEKIEIPEEYAVNMNDIINYWLFVDWDRLNDSYTRIPDEDLIEAMFEVGIF